MRRSRIGLLVLVAAAVSGCASSTTSKSVERLQSHIALLDERVTQLERTSVEWTASSQPRPPATESLAAVAKPTKPTSASVSTSTKPSTRAIQESLRNAGFYQGDIDGKVGLLTRKAVLEFQRVHGLKEDGIVGTKTWAQLREYADLPIGE